MLSTVAIGPDEHFQFFRDIYDQHCGSGGTINFQNSIWNEIFEHFQTFGWALESSKHNIYGRLIFFSCVPFYAALHTLNHATYCTEREHCCRDSLCADVIVYSINYRRYIFYMEKRKKNEAAERNFNSPRLPSSSLFIFHFIFFSYSSRLLCLCLYVPPPHTRRLGIYISVLCCCTTRDELSFTLERKKSSSSGYKLWSWC